VKKLWFGFACASTQSSRFLRCLQIWLGLLLKIVLKCKWRSWQKII